MTSLQSYDVMLYTMSLAGPEKNNLKKWTQPDKFDFIFSLDSDSLGRCYHNPVWFLPKDMAGLLFRCLWCIQIERFSLGKRDTSDNTHTHTHRLTDIHTHTDARARHTHISKTSLRWKDLRKKERKKIHTQWLRHIHSRHWRRIRRLIDSTYQTTRLK